MLKIQVNLYTLLKKLGWVKLCIGKRQHVCTCLCVLSMCLLVSVCSLNLFVNVFVCMLCPQVWEEFLARSRRRNLWLPLGETQSQGEGLSQTNKQ